ncbi:MAG: hypothetical protein AAFV53_22455 [Myxococcota bacterium]
MRYFLFFGLLLGCPESETPSQPGQIQDSGESPSISGQLAFPQGDASIDNLAVGLVRLDFGDPPRLDGTLQSMPITAADADFVFELGQRPPEDLMVELEPTLHPGMIGLVAVGLVFNDQNLDGEYVEGERIVGGSLSRLAIWLEGDVPEAWAEGWNIFDTGMSGRYETGNCLLNTTRPITWRSEFNGSYPIVYDLDEPMDLSVQGLPVPLPLEGEMVGLPDDVQMTLLPFQTTYRDPEDDPETLPGPLAAFSVVDGRFLLTLDEAPSMEADLSGDVQWNYVLGMGVTYQDADEDGAFTLGEELGTATLCADSRTVGLRYTEPVRGYRGWRLMECYGVRGGWSLVGAEPSGLWIVPRTTETLIVDRAECEL